MSCQQHTGDMQTADMTQSPSTSLTTSPNQRDLQHLQAPSVGFRGILYKDSEDIQKLVDERREDLQILCEKLIFRISKIVRVNQEDVFVFGSSLVGCPIPSHA